MYLCRVSKTKIGHGQMKQQTMAIPRHDPCFERLIGLPNALILYNNYVFFFASRWLLLHVVHQKFDFTRGSHQSKAASGKLEEMIGNQSGHRQEILNSRSDGEQLRLGSVKPGSSQTYQTSRPWFSRLIVLRCPRGQCFYWERHAQCWPFPVNVRMVSETCSEFSHHSPVILLIFKRLGDRGSSQET